MRTSASSGMDRLVGLAAGRDGPDGFNLAVPDADVPVMHVGGRVAVARHQPQLLAYFQRAGGVGDHAVLVRAFDVFHVIAAEDEGQTAVHRLCLEARIHDGLVSLGVAHHLSEQEEGVFPFALVDAVAVLVQNAAVVGIHEGIGTALQLVVHAGVRFKVVRASAAAGDQLAFDAFAFQAFNGIGNLRDGDVQLGLAVLIAVHVLHSALISLDAGELEVLCCVHRLGDFHYGFSRCHAAAAGAAVDLDKNFQFGAVLLRCRRQVGNIFNIIDADDSACAEIGQAGQPVDLLRVAAPGWRPARP